MKIGKFLGWWRGAGASTEASMPKLTKSAPEWQVTISALEFNYALARVCDEHNEPGIERPTDVRSALAVATKLVAGRLLSVSDAEVLERSQSTLAFVEGRLIAKAEEDRRGVYLRMRAGDSSQQRVGAA